MHYFTAPARRNDDWRQTTGDVALSYRFGDVNGYLSYARGYQAGGYPPRPFGGPDTFVAFDPTSADSFELGFKGTAGPCERFQLAAFHVGYRDLAVQVNELIGEGFLTLTQNAAESRASGVELECRWQAGAGFDVQFALGYIEIEIAEVDDRVQGIAAGDSPSADAQVHRVDFAAQGLAFEPWRVDGTAGLLPARANVRTTHQYAR